MEFTSERIMPEYYKKSSVQMKLFMMHIESYRYAANMLMNKKVLDFGCGLGYGTDILAGKAESVTGVDVSEETINSINSNMVNAVFKKINILNENNNLPFESEYFDGITFFQVIEHLDNPERHIEEFRRILKPGGLLLITTPNGNKRLFPYQKPWNHHHVKEYSISELTSMLKDKFPYVDVKGIFLARKYNRKENKRVFIRKCMMYPFTNIIIKDSIRRFIIEKIWDITIKKSGSEEDSAYSADILDLHDEDVLISESSRKDWQSILAICKK